MKDRIVAWISLNGPSLGLATLIVITLIMLSGCNTIAGMGTDITKSAEWTRDKMSGSKDSTDKKGGT